MTREKLIEKNKVEQRLSMQLKERE